MKANTDSAKAFIVRHTPCALENGRKGINLTSSNEKKKLQRLFSKDRPVEGVLSQVDEPQQPPKKAPKSREFVDETFSDFEVSDVNPSFNE